MVVGGNIGIYVCYNSELQTFTSCDLAGSLLDIVHCFSNCYEKHIDRESSNLFSVSYQKSYSS